MSISLDEKALKEMLNKVILFKGKDSMKTFIQERLNKSLEAYEYELDKECYKISKLKPKTISNKLKNIE